VSNWQKLPKAEITFMWCDMYQLLAVYCKRFIRSAH